MRTGLVLHKSAAVCFLLSAAMVAFGCVGAGTNLASDPLEQPEFLTPVAEAQAAGVTVYWLGEEFQAGSLLFEITAGSELISRTGNGPGLELTYSAELERGSITFDVESYSRQSGEPEAWREAASQVRGATSQDVRVGNWDGELLFLPLGTRPVNQLWLFLEVGPTVVIAQAPSGGPGIPGEDSNPLIQADLLIEVMEEHLRPYPE